METIEVEVKRSVTFTEIVRLRIPRAANCGGGGDPGPSEQKRAVEIAKRFAETAAEAGQPIKWEREAEPEIIGPVVASFVDDIPF